MLTCAMRVLLAEDDEAPAETGTDSHRLLAQPAPAPTQPHLLWADGRASAAGPEATTRPLRRGARDAGYGSA